MKNKVLTMIIAACAIAAILALTMRGADTRSMTAAQTLAAPETGAVETIAAPAETTETPAVVQVYENPEAVKDAAELIDAFDLERLAEIEPEEDAPVVVAQPVQPAQPAAPPQPVSEPVPQPAPEITEAQGEGCIDDGLTY